MTLLAADHLSKRYRSAGSPKIALDSVHLQVDAGRTVCLLGPNGSGKTTLLKIFAGLITADAGRAEINIQGRSLPPQDAKTWTGFSPADGKSFYGRLTGEENLRFFAGIRGIAEPELQNRLQALSEPLGLGEILKYPVQEISAGMRQRLALARALIHRPQVALLDEPTHSLDPQHVKRFVEYFRREFSGISGRTALWATQDVNEAWNVATEIIILQRGRVEARGTPEDLLRRAKTNSPIDAYLAVTENSHA